MSHNHLIPCPECEAEKPLIEHDFQLQIVWVECSQCFVEADFADDEKTAVDNWNNRAGMKVIARKTWMG